MAYSTAGYKGGLHCEDPYPTNKHHLYSGAELYVTYYEV